MNISIEEQYPSTGDLLPLIAGAQDDLTFSVLTGGRDRVYKGHTTGSYITYGGNGQVVCAVGSILAEEGYSAIDLQYLGSEEIYRVLEEDLSDAAKEAIALLNAKALEFHPEAEDYGSWSGPFEWVNQRGEDWIEAYDVVDDEEEIVKAEILRIYDAVIEERGAPVPGLN